MLNTGCKFQIIVFNSQILEIFWNLFHVYVSPILTVRINFNLFETVWEVITVCQKQRIKKYSDLYKNIWLSLVPEKVIKKSLWNQCIFSYARTMKLYEQVFICLSNKI